MHSVRTDSDGLSDTERQLKLLESIQTMKQDLQQKTYLIRSLHNQLTKENSRVQNADMTAHSQEMEQKNSQTDKGIKSLQDISLEIHENMSSYIDTTCTLHSLLNKFNRFQLNTLKNKLEVY